LSDKSTKAVGFKIFAGHHDKFLEFIAKSSNYEKIILLRNPIARFISFTRAITTGLWLQVIYDEHTTLTKKLIFNPDEFELFLKKHNESFNWYLHLAKQQPHKYLITTYEDVVSRKSIKLILDKLTINCPPKCRMFTDLAKQSTEPIDSCFVNYEQMKDYLISNHPTLLNNPGCPELP